MNARKLRIAIALGKLGSHVHGLLDARNPFDDEGSFSTGTVSGFWGIVWGLAELGYKVDAFTDVKKEIYHAENLGGANVFKIDGWEDWTTEEAGYDAHVSILESDLLEKLPPDKPRICVQWLNDFSYSKGNPLDVVDLFVSPSVTHAEHMVRKVKIPREKISVIPLSNNPEFFDTTLPRRPLSVAYASSPDRGLHHLLDMWPDVRKRAPGAELRVYYRIAPWLNDILQSKAQHGSNHWKRAVAIKKAFDSLGTDGENGLHVVGQLTPVKMAAELCRTEVLAYPCDPVKFTEGFSVTILDACAAGCMPIIAGVDAFPELWTGAMKIIPGRPGDVGAREEWVRSIVATLLASSQEKEALRERALSRAKMFSRKNVALKWDGVLRSTIEAAK